MKNISLLLFIMLIALAFSREIVEIYEVENKQLLKIQFVNERKGIYIYIFNV